MTGPKTIALSFTGDYSLSSSVALSARAAFVGGMRATPGGSSESLQLAFAIEGSWSPIAVSVRQGSEGVTTEILANPEGAPPSAIKSQLERMLCLDVDGDGFDDVAARDPVVAELMAERIGVRPVLFPSPYEAAARAIIGHRLHVNQAAALHGRISTGFGVAMHVGGSEVSAFPAPARLADLSPIPGLSDQKIGQLRALGSAARDGFLAVDMLRAMDRDAAMAHLQRLAGIGPFSAELIIIRGVGDPDAFPGSEMRLHRAMAQAYALGTEPDLATLRRIAETWRPYRSWVGLLLRNRGL